MDMKNLAAGLTTAFALATGVGVAAAEPVQRGPKIDITEPATANFNDHSKGVVFQRNLERDIRSEPILIKEENGRYLFHEQANMFDVIKGEGVGRLKSYSKDGMIRQFGALEGIRTYEQYKADADILARTPGLGPKLSDNAFDMGTRIRDIQSDMKASGETFLPPAPKSKHTP